MRSFDASTYLKEVLGPYLQTTELPDLFERYCLEPSDSDERAIAGRCKEVKQLWDMRLEQPKYGSLIRLLLERHAESLLTLEDPTERRRAAAQAAEAEGARAREVEKAREQWEELLAMALRGGEGIDPAIRSNLERAGEKLGVDRAFVEERLDAAPVRPVRAELSLADRKRIRAVLATFAQDAGEPRAGLTLYHALGLSEITRDVDEIRRRYDERRIENNKRKRDSTSEVRKAVLDLVERTLLNGDPRAYEEALVEDVRDELIADGLKAAVDDGVIDEAEAEELTRRGVALGLTPELAAEVVTRIARESGVPLRTAAPVDYLVCAACGNVLARDRAGERCARCGEALHLSCPKDDCGAVNDATAARCRECGADLHQYLAARRRLPELERLLRVGRLQQAADDLDAVEHVLGRGEEVERIARELAEAMGLAHSEWGAVERAIGSDELYAAQRALRRLCQTAADVPGPESQLAGERLAWVQTRCELAEAALARAREAGGEEREALLAQALAVAADCREAREQLDRIPAGPSPAARASLRGVEVLVAWEPSPTVGVAYELTRVGSDGERTVLGSRLSACELGDPTAPSGAIVHYEIVAVRGTSRTASTVTAPLLVARELQRLEVVNGDGEVRVSWEALSPHVRVLLTRRHDASGAERTLAAESTGFVDRDLENNERYTYLARIQYAGPAGEPVITAGTTIYGQPVARPQPVKIAAAEPTSRGTRVSFDSPAAGTVTVIRCDERPQVSYGQQLEVTELAALGAALIPDPAGALDIDQAPGSRWYLPVTVVSTVAIAGEPHRCLALPAVSKVRAEDNGSEIRVTWTWPEALRATVVAWRQDRQPEGPEDPASQHRVFRRSDYRDHGGFAIDSGPADDSLFVAVFPAARLDGDFQFGTVGEHAVVTRVRKTDVRYAVRRSGLRRKRIEIDVVEPADSSVPELVVVARQGDLLPRQAADGEVIARLGGGGPLSSTLALDRHSRPLTLRAFLSRPAASSSHRVIDPGVEDLVIR